MLVTLMFSVVAINQGLFPVSHILTFQVWRSWEGAQPARQPSWPVEIFHTINIMLSL